MIGRDVFPTEFSSSNLGVDGEVEEEDDDEEEGSGGCLRGLVGKVEKGGGINKKESIERERGKGEIRRE